MVPLVSARRRWGSWWWVFGVLIALPAIALALLGASAIRSDEVERQRQLLDQRQQFALLTDTTLARALDAAAAAARAAATTAETAGTASPQTTFFLMDHRQVLTFPSDRVYVGPRGSGPPPQAAMALPPETTALVSQAQTAEAQGRVQEARDGYERLRPSTELGRWAEWRLAALPLSADDAPAAAAPPAALAESPALAPSGIPVAILASAMAEHVEPVSRRRFAPLIHATLHSLRSGRWWLALDQRRFYDAELRRWLALTGLGVAATAPDPRLETLTDLATSIGRSFTGGAHLEASTTLVQHGHERVLLRWLPPQTHTEGWGGVAIGGVALDALLAGALDPLAADRPFALSLDGQASPVWSGQARSQTQQSQQSPQTRVAMSSFPGWSLTIAESAGGPANGGGFRRSLNYARVGVPLFVLACGLVMTVAIMRRELALARLQSAFVSAVTHEFKSPITAVRLLMERLTNGHLTAADAPGRYHRAIGLEIDRLENLVNRLLNAQRLQSGGKQHEPAPVSLPALVSEAVSGMRPQADAKQITLSTRSAPDIPIVHVDVQSVSDAVRNLVDNAIKYSPAGTTVEVGISRERDRVVMSVADEGVGLEADEVTRLFEPFYRGRRGDRANVHGTGLGLALVKATAEAHGGTVTAEARTPHGSLFSMLLPIAASGSTEASS
jgi:signal transduction histidine kinase